MTLPQFSFTQSMIAMLGWALVHFVWQGCLIALLLAGANVALRRSSAGVRYAVACAAMLLMLAAPIVTFYWLERPPASSIGTFVAEDSSPAPVAALPVSIAAKLAPSFDQYLSWLVSVWMAGVLLLSVRSIGGWSIAQRLKRTGAEPAGAIWQERLVRLASRLAVTRAVRLCESAVAQVPTVIGWLRPVILLPASALAGLSAGQLEAVLAHELAHIRRHDYLVNLIQTAVETLLFYHPLVWWVGKRIRAERENCCDDLAVAACGDVLTYARALADLEQIRATQPRLAMAATGGSLLARIRRLIRGGQPASRFPATWVAGVVAMLSILAVWASAQITFSYHQGDRHPAFEVNQFVAQTAAPVAQAIETIHRATPRRVDLQAAAKPQPEPDDQETPAARPEPAQQPAQEGKGDFIGGLAAAGYQNLSVDDLVSFKIHGVTPEYIRKMQAAGFGKPAPDDLIAMRIHGVTPEFAAEMKAAGFPNLKIDDLVAFRIHGVDPARIREMQALGFGKLTPDDAVALRIHGITPEYAKQMKGLGFGEPSLDQLVALRIHGVTPEFASAIKAAGLTGIDLERLIALRIHGADPAKIREMQGLGFGTLSAEQAIALRIHGVTPEFLKTLKDEGFSNVTLDQAVEARIHGLTPAFLKEVHKRGFNNLNLDQIIKLKQFNIISTPDTI